MEDKEWRFCVVGNIVKQHQGEDGNAYYGTKQFVGGTKVYIADYHTNWIERTVSVIGLNRFHRFEMERISIDLIENVRVQTVFKPKVLQIMRGSAIIDGYHWRGRTAEDRRTVEAYVKEWEADKAKRQNEMTDVKKKTLWDRLIRKICAIIVRNTR